MSVNAFQRSLHFEWIQLIIGVPLFQSVPGSRVGFVCTLKRSQCFFPHVPLLILSSLFLASSVKQSHNERTSTVFHWSHKCTKMRLRRVTSLDSPGQTGRVLHCVCQCSCEKKTKKKYPCSHQRFWQFNKLWGIFGLYCHSVERLGSARWVWPSKEEDRTKKGLFMYSSFLTSKISNLIIFWDHESGQKWVTLLKKRKKKFYFKNVDVSELLLSFIKVSHSLFVFSIWRNLTMKLYTFVQFS